MNNNYPWHQYLFESHSEVTLRQWAKRLQKFRFVRAYGGHANDGDSLVVVYGYNGLWDLQRFFDLLGVQLVVHRQKPAQREPGISYTWEAYDSFPSLIPGTCWVEQPGHCLIGGRGVFAWCEVDKINLSLSSGYCVNESDVTDAEVVEQVLQLVHLPLIDPPVNSKHCICPTFYPEYF